MDSCGHDEVVELELEIRGFVIELLVDEFELVEFLQVPERFARVGWKAQRFERLALSLCREQMECCIGRQGHLVDLIAQLGRQIEETRGIRHCVSGSRG